MKALVHEGRVVQIANSAFEVHPVMSWVDVPAGQGVAPGWSWDGATFVAPDSTPAVPRVDAVAARRYQAEVGGVVWNGWPVATDRDSQSKVNAAYVMAKDGHWPAGAGWKFADGVYRPLTADQVQALALAVAGHVQACFAREAALVSDATADINSGWPA